MARNEPGNTCALTFSRVWPEPGYAKAISLASRTVPWVMRVSVLIDALPS